jgi:hypothetical protein
MRLVFGGNAMAQKARGETPNPASLRVFNREWTQINANKILKIKRLWSF